MRATDTRPRRQRKKEGKDGWSRPMQKWPDFSLPFYLTGTTTANPPGVPGLAAAVEASDVCRSNVVGAGGRGANPTHRVSPSPPRDPHETRTVWTRCVLTDNTTRMLFFNIHVNELELFFCSLYLSMNFCMAQPLASGFAGTPESIANSLR